VNGLTRITPVKTHSIFFAMFAALGARGVAQAPTAQAAGAQSAASFAAGIAYALAPDVRRPNPAFRYAFAVEYALGRGRFDVIEQIPAATVLVDGIDFTPLGRPGEYYLFDSTGFVLVRPSSRTFVRFAVADAAYNFHNGRDGWPDSFPMRQQRIDTVRQKAGGNPSANAASGPHGPVRIFWHVDFDQRLPGFEVVSRGRVTVVDAPFGEATVARWFGPTMALAALAVADSTWFPSERLGLTEVELLPLERGTANNFGLVQSLIGVRRASVDVSRLIVPSGYTETRWGTTTDSVSMKSADRWQSPPHLP
jgi:hypothetical protein